MTKIEINERVYKLHPIYDLYAASKDGYIIHIIKKVPNKGNKNGGGYLKFIVRKHGQSKFKNYYVHRFIWECFNGIIPDGKEIDHINNKRDDNQLCNLQLLTPKENSKKAAENRYDFNNNKRRRCVKATCLKTGETSFYFSMYSVQQHLEIKTASVWKICEKSQYRKSAVSNKNGHSYTFEYIKEEDLPDNYKKSANIRPRKATDEEIKKHRLDWWNMEYKCLKCSKIMKNNSKYKHNKKCNNQQ